MAGNHCTAKSANMTSCSNISTQLIFVFQSASWGKKSGQYMNLTLPCQQLPCTVNKQVHLIILHPIQHCYLVEKRTLKRTVAHSFIFCSSFPIKIDITQNRKTRGPTKFNVRLWGRRFPTRSSMQTSTLQIRDRLLAGLDKEYNVRTPILTL